MEEDTANDEELARALSEQFEAEEAALRASRSQNMNIPVVMATVENEPYLHQHQPSSPVISSQFMDDELRLSEAFANSSPEEIARRVAQEEEDAALAARLAQQDANFASTRGTTPRQAPITEADIQRRRTARRKQSMRSALTCILGVGICVMAFLFINRNRSELGLGEEPINPFDWFKGDNWDWEKGYGGTTGVNTPWRTKNGFSGLELRVLNNLDEGWQGIFDSVMAKWDNGDPDAVNFIVERVNDPNCRTVMGAMIVCNGNYGRTDWRGINEFTTRNGYIQSSIAKLNDYFLARASDDLRTYVCCHEIGHGLGLGHTDESVYNQDLGECMDYTANPGKNMNPGPTNFADLESMYGKVDGTSNREDFNRRMESTIYNHNDKGGDDFEEWKLVHRSIQVEKYERDLGEGVIEHRSILLA